MPQIPLEIQATIRRYLDNPATRNYGVQLLHDYIRKTEPEFGVIGKDPITGEDQRGWINKNNQTVTPATIPGMGQPQANSVIPPAPPGVEPVRLQHVWGQFRVAIPQQSGETQRVLRQIEDMIAPVYREEGTRGLPGQRMLRTHPREALNVRQELDQLHGRLGDSPKAQREVSEYRRLVDEALGEAVPDLKIVDQSYANVMREREAMQRGSQIFDTGKEAIRPEDLIRERQGMTLPQREAMRHGAVAEFDRRMGTNMNDLQALRKSVML